MDTKALHQKILDLAIRGQLVPQDPNDEPASVLLDRIRAEKQKMVKEGKLKAKDIKNDSVIFVGEDNLHYEKFAGGTVKCIEDEIPFELPEGWVWCRLNELFNVCSSKRVLQSDWKTEGIPFYRAREIVKLSENGFVDNELFISDDHYRVLSSDYGVPQAGDLMVSGVGTIGKVYIVKPGDQFYYKDASVLCFENRKGVVAPEFARILLESSFVQNQMKDNSKGTTVDTITISTAMNYLCVIPPLAEQARIVCAVQNALTHVDDVHKGKEELQVLLSSTKAKILDLAIRGQLVPQDPNDEPASVLLERIRVEKEALIKAGKIKRDKKESVIFRGEDNSYYVRQGTHTEFIDDKFIFDLPDNWEWCTLLNVAKIELGKTLDSVKNTGAKHPYLRSANVRWNEVDLADLKEMRFEPEEIDRYTVRRNDLLICEGGDVGRSCVWTDEKEILYQNALHRVRFYGECNPFYFVYYMMYYESRGIIKALCKGVTIKHLTGNVLSLIPFALPPLEEQGRIVERLNQMFALLGTILCD